MKYLSIIFIEFVKKNINHYFLSRDKQTPYRLVFIEPAKTSMEGNERSIPDMGV